MMFKTFALISTLTTERLMTISNLTSLPANIKDLSNMNGRPLSPEKRKWKRWQLESRRKKLKNLPNRRTERNRFSKRRVEKKVETDVF